MTALLRWSFNSCWNRIPISKYMIKTSFVPFIYFEGNSIEPILPILPPNLRTPVFFQIFNTKSFVKTRTIHDQRVVEPILKSREKDAPVAITLNSKYVQNNIWLGGIHLKSFFNFSDLLDFWLLLCMLKWLFHFSLGKWQIEESFFLNLLA